MYHGENSPSLSSFLCRLEWSVGAAGQSVVLIVMTQVAAATLSSGLGDIRWKIYLFLLLPLTSLVFSSTFLFILHFPISFFGPALRHLPPFRFPVLFQLFWAVTQNKMRNWESSLSTVPTDRRGVVRVFVLVRLYVLVIRLGVYYRVLFAYA